MTDATQDVGALQRENAQLKAELDKRIRADERSAARRKRVLKEGGRLLLPLMDRKRVVRSFLQLFETMSRFSGPRDDWPTRDEIIADSRLFSLAFLRFTIRRRLLMFMISLFAFAVPAIQIYLVYQQNEIIENQNKFFKFDVYESFARSMTTGDMASKQITSALIASADLTLLSDIVNEVFRADMGVAFTAQDMEARERRLKDAAFRGHMILALMRSIDLQAKTAEAEQLQTTLQPMFKLVMNDAALRVPELLRFSRSEVNEDPALAEEVYRYLFNLGGLMKSSWTLAVATDNKDQFFRTISPLIARSAGRRSSFFAESSAFSTVFFSRSIQELLVDLALEPEFGEPPPQLAAGQVEDSLKQGFEKLKAGVGDKAGVNWSALKRLAEVP